MIQQLTGDILLSKAQVIAHGVAPHDHFDSGLALALRERWPLMVKDFRHYCHQSNPKAGGLWAWGGADGRVVSLLTQDPAHTERSRPRPATLSNVNHCLRELRKWIEEEGIESLALPRLATGVGGLEWAEVEPLIARYLGDLPVPVYVYTTYEKGTKANEG